MDRWKLARAATFVSLLAAVAAACGGQVLDAVDDRVKASATDSNYEGGSAPKPSRLPCPLGVGEGAACGTTVRTCVDDSTCASPVYECESGKWHAVSQSTCAVETKTQCPTTVPSEQDWCPVPEAKCLYPDTCSLRPSTAGSTRSYECTGSRWTWVSARYDVTCPKDVPENGSPCEPQCGYPTGCELATPCGIATMVCLPATATWHVAGHVCLPEAGTD